MRRQAWLVAVVLAVVLGSAALLLALQEPVYRASMKIVVGQGGGVFRPDAGGSVDSFTQTMTNLLESNVVAQRSIRVGGLRTSADELLGHLGVSTQPQSSVLSVTYDSTDEREAVRALSAIGVAFHELVPRSLSAGTASGSPEGAPTQVTASVFDPAHADTGRISPRPVRTLLIAWILGLVVGVSLVAARETLDPRLRGVAEAEDAFGAPVLGALPSGLGSRRAAHLEAGDRSAPKSTLAALEVLMANVRFGMLGRAGRVVVVTSAMPGEGSSTVAANLGAVLALADEVVCVEADAGAPSLSAHLRVDPPASGLLDVLLGQQELEHVLVGIGALGGGEELDGEQLRMAAGGAVAAPVAARRSVAGLRLLPLGWAQAGLAAALTPKATTQLMRSLRGAARYVVIDAPPLLYGAGARAFAAKGDAVLVVARDGKTTAAGAHAVRSILEGLGVSAGVVLVDSSELVPEHGAVLPAHE